MANKYTPILVTGGTGMLGSYVLRYLVKEGFTNIHASHRASSSFALVEEVKDKITWHKGDLTDAFFVMDCVQEVKQIYHCAAVVSYDNRDRDDMMRINVESTANLVNAALDSSIDKIVHVSSIAALGRRKGLKVIDENAKWERSEMNSNYGISKHLSEMEIWRGMAEGLTVAVVNPSIIVGGGFWEKSSARFFRNIAKGFPFYSVGGSGFVDARDVARFMVKTMNSELHGERYILNGENLSYQDFFNKIADALSAKRPHIKVTPFIQGLAWRVEWLRSRLTGTRSLVTKETAENSARTWRFANQKSLSAFEDFSYTPISETIAEAAKVFEETQESGAGYLPIV